VPGPSRLVNSKGRATSSDSKASPRHTTVSFLLHPPHNGFIMRLLIGLPYMSGYNSPKPKAKQFGQPDELRKFKRGKLQLINLGMSTIGRVVYEPGWRWSKHVKPIAKTKSCEASHFLYHVTGVLHIRMDDGTEMDVGPEEVSWVPPGHDAWVVGEEPVTLIDFQGMVDYAKEPSKGKSRDVRRVATGRMPD